MKLIIVLLSSALFLSACGKNADTQDAGKQIPETKTEKVQAETSDPVLVTVGDSVITQSQVEVLFNRMTEKARNRNPNDLNQLILKSIIRARVLALTAEKQMSSDELNLLNAKVQAYKDELLAKHYINTNITAHPVTNDMVLKYYKEHQQDYVKQGKVTFELLTTTDTIDDAIMGDVIKALSEAKTEADWKAYATSLKNKKFPVEYKMAKILPNLISEEIRSQITVLEIGQVTDIVYGKRLFIAKVTDKQSDTVQPLSAVSMSIRNRLAPQQLKKAMTKSIDEASKTIQIKYVKQGLNAHD